MPWKVKATAKYYFHQSKLLLFIVATSSIIFSWWATRGKGWTPEPDNKPNFFWQTIPAKHPIKSFAPVPSGDASTLPRVQASDGAKTELDKKNQQERLAAIKGNFTWAWTSYKEHAWLRDELRPMSGSFRDTHGGWALTLIDSLDTLWLFGLREDFDEAVNAVATIDFDTPKAYIHRVDILEISTRYMGGLLGAYEISEYQYPVLLIKATQLGHFLYHAFDTPNHLPITEWDPRVTLADDQSSMVATYKASLAAMAGITLEFTRLSQLTGDPRWYDAVQRVMNFLASQQNASRYPGLWPASINARDETIETYNDYDRNADIAYEVLPKIHVLLGGGTNNGTAPFQDMYAAFSTAVQHLFIFRPNVPRGATTPMLLPRNFPSGAGPQQVPHNACNLGATLGLGHTVFPSILPTSPNGYHVNVSGLATAQALTHGCALMHTAMPHGVMPAAVYVEACPTNGDCQFTEKHRVEITSGCRDPYELCPMFTRLPAGATSFLDKSYDLRPEMPEALWYLFRLTGDRRFQEEAWQIFESVITAVTTKYGHARLVDCVGEFVPKTFGEWGGYEMHKDMPYQEVMAQVRQMDKMPSWWLGETLKYFWLVFADEEVLSLDEWVVSSAGHPFRWRKKGDVPEAVERVGEEEEGELPVNMAPDLRLPHREIIEKADGGFEMVLQVEEEATQRTEGEMPESSSSIEEPVNEDPALDLEDLTIPGDKQVNSVEASADASEVVLG